MRDTYRPHVTAMSSVDNLACLGQSYTALLAQIPDGRGLFYAPERLRIMAPHYLPDPSHGLLFLLAWRGEQLIGVAPLMTIRQGWRQCFLRRVNFWGGEPGPSRMEGAFLIPDPHEVGPCLEAFVHHLRHRRPRIDLIDLRYFRSVSPCSAAFTALDGTRRIRQEDMVTHRARLPESFEQYLVVIDKSFRTRTMNRMRAVQRDLNAELHCVSALDEDTLAQVAALHTARQHLLSVRGQTRHAVFEQEPVMVTSLLELMATTGQARHYLLKSGPRVIAFALGFHARGTWYYWMTSFDHQLARYEPGRVVVLMAIRHEIECHGTTLVDMMAGTTQVKLGLGNQVVTHDHCSGPGSVHLVSRLKRALKASLSARAP